MTATAFDLHMTIAERSEAIALIGLRIFLIANAHQRRLEQAYDRRQHFLARHAATREILLHLGPIFGSALPNISIFPYLPSSRTSRQRGW